MYLIQLYPIFRRCLGENLKIFCQTLCHTACLTMVWHLSLITILSLLPGALATGWDDFADDLATDLVCCLSHTFWGTSLMTV